MKQLPSTNPASWDANRRSGARLRAGRVSFRGIRTLPGEDVSLEDAARRQGQHIGRDRRLARRSLSAEMERLTQRLGSARVDLNVIDEVLSALRDEVVPLLQGESDKQRFAEDLFHAVRLSTSAAQQRGFGRAHLELTRWARRISSVCNSLSACADYAELRARASELLPQLGLRDYFVAVYDTPDDPNQARLLLSSESGLLGRVFRGRELLPPEIASVEGVGRSYAVLPLLGRRALLGHILIEYTAQHAFTCGAISEAIGIAIRNLPSAASTAEP